MRRLYQGGWFGIMFSDISVNISEDDIADLEFYSKFYEEFYRRFNSYDDLHEYWKIGKDEVAKHISLLVKNKKNILSIGCGTGYIEKKIDGLTNDKSILAIEPGAKVVQWIDKSNIKVIQGFFPDALEKSSGSYCFDFVYASSIDYVFDNQGYSKFLKSLIDFGIEEILLTEIVIPREDSITIIKDFIKAILSKLKLRGRGQFWGYLRNIEEHKIFLKNAGFKVLDIGKYNNGNYWIMARKN